MRCLLSACYLREGVASGHFRWVYVSSTAQVIARYRSTTRLSGCEKCASRGFFFLKLSLLKDLRCENPCAGCSSHDDLIQRLSWSALRFWAYHQGLSLCLFTALLSAWRLTFVTGMRGWARKLFMQASPVFPPLYVFACLNPDKNTGHFCYVKNHIFSGCDETSHLSSAK